MADTALRNYQIACTQPSDLSASQFRDPMSTSNNTCNFFDINSISCVHRCSEHKYCSSHEPCCLWETLWLLQNTRLSSSGQTPHPWSAMHILVPFNRLCWSWERDPTWDKLHRWRGMLRVDQVFYPCGATEVWLQENRIFRSGKAIYGKHDS